MHPAHWMSLQMGASLPNDRCVRTALAGLPGRCLAHADGYFFQCHRNLKLTRQVEIVEFVCIAQAFIGHELHILTARNVLFVLVTLPFFFPENDYNSRPETSAIISLRMHGMQAGQIPRVPRTVPA